MDGWIDKEINGYGLRESLQLPYAYSSSTPTAPLRLQLLYVYSSPTYSSPTPTAPLRLQLLYAYSSSTPTAPLQISSSTDIEINGYGLRESLQLPYIHSSSTPTAPLRLPYVYSSSSPTSTAPLRLQLLYAYSSSTPTAHLQIFYSPRRLQQKAPRTRPWTAAATMALFGCRWMDKAARG
jgi:hypothetical protein